MQVEQIDVCVGQHTCSHVGVHRAFWGHTLADLSHEVLLPLGDQKPMGELFTISKSPNTEAMVSFLRKQELVLLLKNDDGFILIKRPDSVGLTKRCWSPALLKMLIEPGRNKWMKSLSVLSLLELRKTGANVTVDFSVDEYFGHIVSGVLKAIMLYCWPHCLPQQPCQPGSYPLNGCRPFKGFRGPPDYGNGVHVHVSVLV